MAIAVTPEAEPGELDELVAEVCLTLQISPTQFDLARQHYEAVGDWLSRPGSPLADLGPRIYPQGGMALRTTVRPREREEYDLDMVLEVRPTDSDPMVFYEQVHDRLADHGDYEPRLERMKRCLRLRYPHDFHLDILPARLDKARHAPNIEVPDTKLECWMPSNPLGYIAWFEHKCNVAAVLKAAREQLPLPPPLSEQLAKVLRQAVQLIKRRRDNVFRNRDTAPRSVVLTTLAGEHYAGSGSLVGALEQILAAIDQQIALWSPRPIEVRNPTNPDELFSESWSNPAEYEAFVRFVRDFRVELAALRVAEGLHELSSRLDRMFGDDLGEAAVRSYTKRIADAKAAGTIRFGAPGIIVGSKKTGIDTHPSPRHNFHHGVRDHGENPCS